MLPTLPPTAEIEASSLASVPGCCTLRTRTVRMSLRSHAMIGSFRIEMTLTLASGPDNRQKGGLPFLLYDFDEGIQLVKRFDGCAIGIREDVEGVVEHWLKPRAARANHVGIVIIPDIDYLPRLQVHTPQSVLEDTRVWLETVHLARGERKIEK